MGVQWRQDLAVGVDIIDEQHQELFSRINQLLDACNLGKGKEEVGALINFLEDYVKTHFRDEEELQRKHKYPEYDNHKNLHNKFIDEVTSLKIRLNESGTSLLLIIDINRKVVDWLVNHIGKMDKELGKYIKAQTLTLWEGNKYGEEAWLIFKN